MNIELIMTEKLYDFTKKTLDEMRLDYIMPISKKRDRKNCPNCRGICDNNSILCQILKNRLEKVSRCLKLQKRKDFVLTTFSQKSNY